MQITQKDLIIKLISDLKDKATIALNDSMEYLKKTKNIDLAYKLIKINGNIEAYDCLLKYLNEAEITTPVDPETTDALKRLKAIKQIASGHEFSFKQSSGVKTPKLAQKQTGIRLDFIKWAEEHNAALTDENYLSYLKIMGITNNEVE
mgnify:CR=1 FL=1